MEELMTADKQALKEFVQSIVNEALKSNGHPKEENYLLLELRHQRELMERGFTEMNRRFEEMKVASEIQPIKTQNDRLIALELELKHQRELMEQRFKHQRELMEKGFEAVDKRF